MRATSLALGSLLILAGLLTVVLGIGDHLAIATTGLLASGIALLRLAGDADATGLSLR